ncbi:MAG: DNA mismatch repair endonuclease MutL [Opitutaceae bacterium]|nr:DNA mismatch repair endonuclease MutL [Cytophagales bacterium]
MQSIIRLLPDSLANQIAAGEVVQRPASVVKELLENSVDAGSKNIRLLIKDAGRTLIQVIDDGKGMSEIDARMCFERHATSKLYSTEDLFNIRTMGFRGEAMASIGAVAQVELSSRRETDELGTCLHIEGSQITSQECLQTPVGTNTQVKNLFFNVPARRNFLKSDAVENKHIMDEFIRIALSNPEIALFYTQNNTEIFHLPAAKLSQRIVGIYGNQYKENLIPCNEETPFLKVWGYIGKPEFARKTRGEQFFMVNRRFIKNAYLHFAVADAFKNLIAPDYHPFYVLFIEIDPSKIDINVHPTKTEIKFEDERTVHGILSACVRKSLGANNITPSLDYEPRSFFSDFNTDKNFNLELENKGFTPKFKMPSAGKINQDWQKLYEGIGKFNPEPEQTELLVLPSKGNDSAVEIAISSVNKSFLVQLHCSYILTPVKSGLMMIHQERAHERILFEKFIQHLDQKHGISQQLLFPIKIDLPPADHFLIMEMEKELAALGISIADLGGNTIALNGVPADITAGNEKRLLEDLLNQFKQNKKELNLSLQDNLARSMAKRCCLRKNCALGQEELQSIIDQLFACTNPNYTPGGEKIVTLMGKENIEDLFS